MSRKTLSPASVFEMVLRAHETGGVTFLDVRTQLKQLLASGASPADLLETLRRQQQWEPLPEPAHIEVLELIDEAMRAAPAHDDPNAATAAPAGPGDAVETPADDPNEFELPGLPPDVGGRLGTSARGPQTERPARAQNMRSLEARIAGQQADYTALTRSYERAREAESAANARAATLTADLSTAQEARDSERARAQQLGETLAETVAAGEALRARGEVVMRDSRDLQTEIRNLRHAKQARDVEFEEITRRLVERDAQLESLEQERQRMLPQWAAHAAQLAEARAALAGERRRIEMLDVAMQARDAALVEAQQSLGARDVELSTLQQERVRTAPLLEARTKVATQLEADLHATSALLAAEQAKSERVEREVVSLQQERVRTAPLLEAGNQATTQLQAELQAARAALTDARRALKEREAQLETAVQTATTHGQRNDSAAEQYQQASNRLRESLAAGAATIAELETEQQRAQASNRALTDRAAASDAAVARSEEASREAQRRHAELRGSLEADLRNAVARIDALTRELAVRAVVEPVATVAAMPTPTLANVPQPTAAPRPQPHPQAAPTPRPNRLGLIAAAAAALLCVLVIYFFSHRAPATLPAVVSAAPAPALPKAGTVIRDCLTCPEITILPTGKFSQGSAGVGVGPAAFEKPLHVVAIKHVIGMATNLVTVDEFQQFITASGWESQGCTTYNGEWKDRPKNSWSNPGFVQTGKHPVTCASWNDAQAYAKWLSVKAGHSYRLPSASEWEYAARAGGAAVAPWSAESAACENANVADKSATHRYPGWAAFNCDDGYVYTSPVGSFKPNAFGLNDMLGNVFQWTQDCWHPDYVGAPIDGSARSDGQCVEHELRGGSWFTTPAYVRANYRNHFTADYRSSTVGIRLVRDFES